MAFNYRTSEEGLTINVIVITTKTFSLCCIYGFKNTVKDLTPYLYPALHPFATDVLTNSNCAVWDTMSDSVYLTLLITFRKKTVSL